MRIIHTGDWHIGQLFMEHDRVVEHAAFLEWLLGRIKEFGVDVLLIAGDVFDSPNPSAAAQRMLYDFLRAAKVKSEKLQIVLIAGNHDSAARLEAPVALLEGLDISVKGIVRRDENGDIDIDNLIVPLMINGRTEAWCMAVPYLRQGDYPVVEDMDGDVYVNGVGLMYRAVLERVMERRESGQAIVAMGHLHASGSEISDSERSIIGGLEYVSSDIFGVNIAYTGLGHLHKAQRVGGSENIRYAGSPLPMSFAERDYSHGVTMIDIVGEEVEEVRRLSFESAVKLLSIPKLRVAKPFVEVQKELWALPDGEVDKMSPFLEVKVLLEGPEPSLRYDIETALKGKAVRLVRVVSESKSVSTATPSILNYDSLKIINPLNMAKDVYQRKYSEDMPQELELLWGNIKIDLV